MNIKVLDVMETRPINQNTFQHKTPWELVVYKVFSHNKIFKYQTQFQAVSNDWKKLEFLSKINWAYDNRAMAGVYDW